MEKGETKTTDEPDWTFLMGNPGALRSVVALAASFKRRQRRCKHTQPGTGYDEDDFLAALYLQHEFFMHTTSCHLLSFPLTGSRPHLCSLLKHPAPGTLTLECKGVKDEHRGLVCSRSDSLGDW